MPNELASEPQPSPISTSPHSAWRRLLSGRYQIASWYDRGDRRYVLARPLSDSARERITPRQCVVLAARAKGAALKVIAFDLGVSIGTVSRDLMLGMRSLGLASTNDLAAVLGHVSR